MRLRLLMRLVTLGFSLFVEPFAAMAEPPTKVPRVGVLNPHTSTEFPTVPRDPFEHGLRGLGWTPGASPLIEYRYAEGEVDRLPELAAALVRLPVDVLVTRDPQATQAARQATSTIPIGMAATSDPVRPGFAASLAWPGGNITGLAFVAQGGLAGKRLELLKQAVPGLTRTAFLVHPLVVPDQDTAILAEINVAARALRLEVQPFEVRRPRDIVEAFTALGKAQVGALLVGADPHALEPNLAQVVALARAYRLPAIYPWRLYGEAGGLMSSGTSIMGFGPSSASRARKGRSHGC
jgi:putative ABC transport system substrate-binding protein